MRFSFRQIFINISIFLLLAAAGLHADEFKFAVFGDTQFDNPDVFARIVKQTDLLKPALVLQTGDMITGYSYDPEKIKEQWKRFKNEIAPLSMPFHPAVGNHDVTTTETESLYQEIWGMDSLYYSFDYKKSHFIMLNTFLHGEYDKIPDEEMKWFKEDLEKNKSADNIFIAFHSPLFNDKKFDWESIHQMLLKYPVRAVFTGHSHVSDCYERDKIFYFQVNTSGQIPQDAHASGYSHGFLHVSVQGNDITYATVTKDGIFSPADVPHGEALRAGSYRPSEGTAIIPDTTYAPTDTEIEIPIKNSSPEEIEYILTWEINDLAWKIDPFFSKVKIKSKESSLCKFHITGPQGKFTRNELPRLRIDVTYNNSAGIKTTLTNYYKLFYPPETSASKRSAEFNFDGKLSDKEWTSSRQIENLFTDVKNTPAKDKTLVKFMYDDEFIYVGIKGDEPAPAGLMSLAHGDLPLVFSDDCFEVYFDINHKLGDYYRIMTNPKGTKLNSSPAGLLTFNFEVKTYVGSNYWSAEFKVPYKEMKASPPKPGDIWGVNIRRNRTQAESAISEWSRMRGFPAQPVYFGIMKFE